MGNTDVPGPIASGLAYALEETIEYLPRLRARYERKLDELRSELKKAGIDPPAAD